MRSRYKLTNRELTGDPLDAPLGETLEITSIEQFKGFVNQAKNEEEIHPDQARYSYLELSITNDYNDNDINNLVHLCKYLNIDSLKITSLTMSGAGGQPPDSKYLFSQIKNIAGLTELELSNFNRISVNDLEKIRKLQTLNSFTLSGSTFLDERGCEEIGKMKELRELRILCHSNFTNDTLKKFEKLTELETLHISGNAIDKINDNGLKIISKLDRLRSLTLGRNVFIKNKGLEYISTLKHLEQLTIYGDFYEVKADGWQHISKLQDLKMLELGSCELVDFDSCALEYIGKLQNLEDLCFTGFDLGYNQSDLCYLTELTKLQRIELNLDDLDQPIDRETLCELASNPNLSLEGITEAEQEIFSGAQRAANKLREKVTKDIQKKSERAFNPTQYSNSADQDGGNIGGHFPSGKGLTLEGDAQKGDPLPESKPNHLLPPPPHQAVEGRRKKPNHGKKEGGGRHARHHARRRYTEYSPKEWKQNRDGYDKKPTGRG